MKNVTHKFTLSLITLNIFAAPLTFAAQTSFANDIIKALSESDVKLSFRARDEAVEQEDIDKTANALTIKSRLTMATGSYKNFSLGLEVDNVSALVDNYNSTQNGQAEYPAVADPTGTDVNQGFVKYSNNEFTAVVGRQRIVHNNQRFVGGVAWRQNEQTFDALRLQYNTGDLNADYSFVSNINDITGHNVSGDFHLANVGYTFNKAHKISGFSYVLDYNAASNAGKSTTTFGGLYNAKFGPVFVNASAASQSDNGENTESFSATYLNAEVGGKVGPVTLLAGYELLGSDNGVGFSTPLATLHKFQGFSDKFLSTPAEGIQDVYLTVKGAVSGVNLSATYHDLSSDINDKDYGSEIDLVAVYSINKNYKTLIKLATYSATDHATDTSKLWLQAEAKF